MHTESVEMMTIRLISPRNRPKRVRIGFGSVVLFEKQCDEMDRLICEKPKTDRGHFQSQSTTLGICTYVHVRVCEASAFPRGR